MKVLIAIIKWLLKIFFRIRVTGAENIPSEGACIICLNHISLFDPIVSYCYLPRPIRFIGKEELMRVPVVAKVLKAMRVIPVKRGTADIGAVKASLQTLKNGEILGIFPTGTREKKNENAPAKPGVALIATKADKPVIPIHIIANYRIFSKVKLVVGPAVDISEYSGKRLTQEELQEVADKIYSTIKSLE